MARYTHNLTVALPKAKVQDELATALRACDLEVLHQDNDYLVAREVPGRSGLAQLVTVEVLINDVPVEPEITRLNVVLKNEELPLNRNNHCSQIYQQVRQALTESRNWELIGSVAGI